MFYKTRINRQCSSICVLFFYSESFLLSWFLPHCESTSFYLFVFALAIKRTCRFAFTKTKHQSDCRWERKHSFAACTYCALLIWKRRQRKWQCRRKSTKSTAESVIEISTSFIFSASVTHRMANERCKCWVCAMVSSFRFEPNFSVHDRFSSSLFFFFWIFCDDIDNPTLVLYQSRYRSFDSIHFSSFDVCI